MNSDILKNEFFENDNIRIFDNKCFFGGKISAKRKLSLYNVTRSSFTLMYVVKGKGKFICNGVEHMVEKNQTMLGYPNVECSIICDQNDPWELVYICFMGFDIRWMLSKTNFSLNHPVSPPILHLAPLFDIFEGKNEKEFEKFRTNSRLYYLLSFYVEHFPLEKKNNTPYVEKALEYINWHYKEPDCTVGKVVNILKVERSYLFKLFKKELGLSVQNYINQCRISKASAMLGSSNMTIKDIAYSVGYTDQLYFSKVFKKHLGVSPTDYRINFLKE